MFHSIRRCGVDALLFLMISLIISPLLFQSFSIQFLTNLHAQAPNRINLARILLDDALDALKKNDATKALMRLNLASQVISANETLPLNESKSNSLQLAKIFIDDASDAVKSGVFDKASQRILLAEQQLPLGSLIPIQSQIPNSKKQPLVFDQKVNLVNESDITLRGVDPINKSLTFSIIKYPSKGSLILTKVNSSSVNATYYPSQDGILKDSFSYKANDGVSDSNIGKVSITYSSPQTSDIENTTTNIQPQSVNQSLQEQEQPPPNNTNPLSTVWTVSIVSGASDMGDRAYSPDSVNIWSGDTVKWINDDTQFHTVTSGAGPSDSMKGNEFDSGLSGPNALTRNGKTFSHTFTESGEFPYYCQLHPTMVGKVVVSKSEKNPNAESSQQQTPNIDTGSFDSYNNSTYGISIDFPSDWTHQGGNKSGTVTDVVSFFSPENDSYIELRISVDEVSNSESLEKYRSDSVDGFLTDPNFQNFVLSDGTDRLYWADPLSGHRVYKIVGTYQDPETKSTQKIMEIGTITGENLAYIIRFYADPTKFSYYLPTIQKMIDSFEINNNRTETPIVPEESPPINNITNPLPEVQPSPEQQPSSNAEPNPSGYSGIDYTGICSKLQPVLVNSCDTLVNPDGSLTFDGTHAMHCIRNGILLGTGASLFGVPLPLVLKGLSILAAAPTGCGEVVQMSGFSLLNNIGSLHSLVNLLP